MVVKILHHNCILPLSNEFCDACIWKYEMHKVSTLCSNMSKASEIIERLAKKNFISETCLFFHLLRLTTTFRVFLLSRFLISTEHHRLPLRRRWLWRTRGLVDMHPILCSLWRVLHRAVRSSHQLDRVGSKNWSSLAGCRCQWEIKRWSEFSWSIMRWLRSHSWRRRSASRNHIRRDSSMPGSFWLRKMLSCASVIVATLQDESGGVERLGLCQLVIFYRPRSREVNRSTLLVDSRQCSMINVGSGRSRCWTPSFMLDRGCRTLRLCWVCDVINRLLRGKGDQARPCPHKLHK